MYCVPLSTKINTFYRGADYRIQRISNRYNPVSNFTLWEECLTPGRKEFPLRITGSSSFILYSWVQHFRCMEGNAMFKVWSSLPQEPGQCSWYRN